MTHLERDWETSGHYIGGLAEDFTVIRYDQRGNGLSDWENVDLSFDRMVDDLKCVIDCYDYDQVSILGAEAKVSRIILHPHHYLERFYGELGYSRFGGEEIAGPHRLIKMEKYV